MSALALELDDATVLDLFAGSGALGIEALSRGAAHVTFVEQAPRALSVLRSNLADLDADPSTYELLRADAIRYAGSLAAGSYAITLADPPYEQGFATALAQRFAEVPFSRLLCIEHSPSELLPGNPLRERRYGDSALTFFAHDD